MRCNMHHTKLLPANCFVFAYELPASKGGVKPNLTAAFSASNSSPLPRELEKAADAQDIEASQQYEHAVAGPIDVWLDEPVKSYI